MDWETYEGRDSAGRSKHIKSVRYSEVPEGKEHCEDLHWSPSQREYVPLWNYMLLAPISPMPNRFTPHYIIPSLKCLFIDIIVVFRKCSHVPSIQRHPMLSHSQTKTMKDSEGDRRNSSENYLPCMHTVRVHFYATLVQLPSPVPGLICP